MVEWYHSVYEKARLIEGASQRVQEDTIKFTRIMESLGTSLIEAIMVLVQFTPILFGLSIGIPIFFFGDWDYGLIVGALIHDLGDDLAPANHSQLASTIIRPYVREEVTWIISMHGLFQMFYFGPKEYMGNEIGIDKSLRERYKDHKWFSSCDKFCRDWDQMSFDPDYPTKSLDYFKPLVNEIFSITPFDPKFVGKPEFE